jgi:hypothetical protein
VISIEIKGLEQVQRMIGNAGKQARFAAAVALTRTGQKVATDLRAAMTTALPGASPYSLKSQFSTRATPAKMESIVGIKDKKPSGGTAPAMLLKEHFGGGARGNKPMEKALRSIIGLRSDWQVVPGAGMPLDRHYGNPKRAAVAEVLGALRSGMKVHSGRGKRMAALGYFVALPGDVRTAHLAPGVYRRIERGGSSALIPVFLFIQRATYRKVLDLPRLAQRVVDRDFQAIFATEYENALATAR